MANVVDRGGVVKAEGCKTILIVEDEALIAMAEALAIKTFGYAVQTARNGAQAVELAASNDAIDLVLMDINLGIGIDGPETARRILEKRDIPIVFLTSHSEKEFVDRVKEITRYGYIVKNSGDFVLRSSIEMAFELFAVHTQLKVSEEKYRLLFESADDAIFIHDTDGHILAANPQACARLGYSPVELSGMIVSQIDTPNEAQHVPQRLQQLEEHGYALFESVHQHKNGSMIPTEIGARRISWDGRPAVMSICRDITARRQAENALRESEEKFRNLFNNAEVGMFRTRLDGSELLDLNDKYLAILGRTRAETVGQPSVNLWADPVERAAMVKTLNENGRVDSLECRLLKNDGTVIDCITSLRLYREQGILEGSIMDITERKRAEETLRQSEEKYRGLYNHASLGIFHSTFDGRFIDLNPALAKMMGYDSPVQAMEEITNIASQIYAEPQKRDEAAASALQAGGTTRTENLYRRRDGSLWHGILHLRIVPAQKGVASHFEGFIEDISELKSAEDRNALTEARLQRLLDILQHPSSSIQDFLDYALAQALELTGSKLGYIYHYHAERQEFVLNTWSRDVMAECRVINPQTCYELAKTGIWGEAVRQARPIVVNDFQASHPLKKGYPAGHVQLSRYMTVPVFKEAVIVGVVGLANKESDYQADDILQVSLLMEAVWKVTDRKQAEENVRSLLAEKEIILKEVHHRVKNNMMTMMGLLSLQAGAMRDPAAAAAILDARGRLQGMELLYDKLYHADNLQAMSIRDYLPGLVHEIVQVFPNCGAVEIVADVEPFLLQVEQLATLGIIVNELVTNIMKYAFAGRDHGLITVSAMRAGKAARVIVADDGAGIPATVSLEHSNGFGLHLVGMLTEQLGGTMRIERGNGTRFILEFEI